MTGHRTGRTHAGMTRSPGELYFRSAVFDGPPRLGNRTGSRALGIGGRGRITAPPVVRRKPPDYLSRHYWWAYIHPLAVQIFERQWLVDLILFGNYARLRDAALAALGPQPGGTTLQVACVYGDLTSRLARKVSDSGGRVDVVDVLPIQLRNLGRKLPVDSPVRLLAMDSSALDLADASYDRALAFFLLHEQPREYRERTLRELFRVVRPGGSIVIVDYARPRWWNPLRYLWQPVLAMLEPFALDLWREEATSWLPRSRAAAVSRKTFFGGLYQALEIRL